MKAAADARRRSLSASLSGNDAGGGGGPARRGHDGGRRSRREQPLALVGRPAAAAAMLRTATAERRRRRGQRSNGPLVDRQGQGRAHLRGLPPEGPPSRSAKDRIAGAPPTGRRSPCSSPARSRRRRFEALSLPGLFAVHHRRRPVGPLLVADRPQQDRRRRRQRQRPPLLRDAVPVVPVHVRGAVHLPQRVQDDAQGARQRDVPPVGFLLCPVGVRHPHGGDCPDASSSSSSTSWRV